MRRALLLGGIGAMLLVVMTTPNAAYAAAKGCELYAQRAVSQYKMMARTKGCQVAESARWQGNYQNHLAWCKSRQPQPNGDWSKIWHESDVRDKWLTKCSKLGW